MEVESGYDLVGSREKILDLLEEVEGLIHTFPLKNVPLRELRVRAVKISPARKELLQLIRLKEIYLDLNATLSAMNRLLMLDKSFESAVEHLENVLDVSGQEPEVEEANLEEKENILGLTLSLDNFFSRPVKVYSDTLALETIDVFSIPIWDNYTLDNAVRNKLRQYAYLRADMVVKIVVSGTPFHYGRLLCSYQPYPLNNTALQYSLNNFLAEPGFQVCLNNYLSQASGRGVIDVNQNDPLEIKIPFISAKPAHRLFNYGTGVIGAGVSFADLANAGSLYISVLNYVESTNAGASPIGIMVYAWLENVELGSATGTQITIDPETDERAMGPIQYWASASSRVASLFKDIPVIDRYATTASIATGKLADLASYLGLSKPAVPEDPLFVKNVGFQNGAVTVGYDTNFKITLDPMQELTIDPSIIGSSEDEMTIAAIAKRESYFTTIDWALADSELTPFYTIGVSPQLSTNYTAAAVDYIQPTAIAFTAAPFLYWHGSMEFRVEVVCSAFHRGKFAIIYEPNVNQQTVISSNLSTNRQFLKMVDIQEEKDFTFTIDWSQPRYWNKLLGSDAVKNLHGSSTDLNSYFGWVNGILIFVPITVLQSPDSSSVHLNVYTKSSNIEYNRFSATNLPVGRLTFETDSVVLNAPNQIPTTNALLHFGEQPRSFRALLKRFATTRVTDAVTSAVPTHAVYTIPIIPDISLLFGGFGDDYPSLFSYMRYAYLGMRGGIKKRLRFTSAYTQTPYDQVKVSLSLETSSNSETVGTGTISNTYSDFEGTVTFIPSSNGGFEVELPYYSNNLFMFSCVEDMMGTFATQEYINIWTKLYHVVFPVETCTSMKLVEDSSIGEDFSFLRFLGAPAYTYGT